MTTKRKTDYLFWRHGRWNIKLQSPDKRIERSLGTADRRQAEVLALPMIAEHKAKLLARRPAIVTEWQSELSPGLHDINGERIFATERELSYLDATGAVIRTAPNGRLASRITGKLPGDELLQPGVAARWHRTVQELINRPQPAATKNSGDDDALIESYIKHAGVVGFKAGEARATWALWRSLCPGVKLANASRDDGRKLVEHLFSIGNKRGTVQKKIMWLNAAVNFQIKEGRLRFNPFAAILPKKKRGDAIKRLPFSDDDINLIRANLDKLAPEDQLLVRVLATTGMRLGEAFQINGERQEKGIRYVVVGTKTEQSERRVPLPLALLPFLPPVIKGRLFEPDREKYASQRLNKGWLRKIGITDPAKTIHSFRHRAQDRLRAAGCSEDKRWGILGHEKATVAEGYGEGFSMTVLKPYTDEIGF